MSNQHLNADYNDVHNVNNAHERITKAPWYFGGVTRRDVKDVFSGMKEDAFVVRDSSEAGSYAVSIFLASTK